MASDEVNYRWANAQISPTTARIGGLSLRVADIQYVENREIKISPQIIAGYAMVVIGFGFFCTALLGGGGLLWDYLSMNNSIVLILMFVAGYLLANFGEKLRQKQWRLIFRFGDKDHVAFMANNWGSVEQLKRALDRAMAKRT